MNTTLNKILNKEDYEFYKEYQKEYKNMMDGQEHIMFTNTGVHAYSNLTLKKVKNIVRVGIFYEVPMDKIKDNVTFIQKTIIDRYPGKHIEFMEMNKLKFLFIDYIGYLNLFDENKYNFFLSLPINLEILVIRIPPYMQPEEHLLSYLCNLPVNLKYFILCVPIEKKYTTNIFKKIKLPLNCSLYYSESSTLCINENLTLIM